MFMTSMVCFYNKMEHQSRANIETVTDPDESISKVSDDIKAHKSVLRHLAGVLSRISEETMDAWAFHERGNIWVSLTGVRCAERRTYARWANYMYLQLCDELKSYYIALEEKASEAKENASNANAISDELVNLQKELKVCCLSRHFVHYS